MLAFKPSRQFSMARAWQCSAIINAVRMSGADAAREACSATGSATADRETPNNKVLRTTQPM
jgi:hypothetical protein